MRSVGTRDVVSRLMEPSLGGEGTLPANQVKDLDDLGEDLAERISALTPDLMAVDAFDPFDERLMFNARHGVTTFGLAPLSANTFSGVTAVVRAGDMGEVLSDAAYLKLALVAESYDQGRYPTSRMGAAEMIRASFELAREPLAPPTPAQRALRSVVEGSTRLAIHAREHNAIQSALELFNELGAQPLLIGGDQSDELLEAMAAAGTSVVLAPLHPGMTEKALQLPARLEKAGIPFSFMADAPPPVAAVGKPQLMPGLPGGDRAEALASLRRALELEPAFLRIYPIGP